MYFVYIIWSVNFSRFYIGTTKNTAKRLSQHNAGENISARAHRPWKLVYVEDHPTLQKARLRERKIKSWKSTKYMINQLDFADLLNKE